MLGNLLQYPVVVATEQRNCRICTDVSDLLLRPAVDMPERSRKARGDQRLAQGGAGREVDGAVKVDVPELLLTHVEVDAVDL